MAPRLGGGSPLVLGCPWPTWPLPDSPNCWVCWTPHQPSLPLPLTPTQASDHSKSLDGVSAVQATALGPCLPPPPALAVLPGGLGRPAAGSADSTWAVAMRPRGGAAFLWPLAPGTPRSSLRCWVCLAFASGVWGSARAVRTDFPGRGQGQQAEPCPRLWHQRRWPPKIKKDAGRGGGRYPREPLRLPGAGCEVSSDHCSGASPPTPAKDEACLPEALGCKVQNRRLMFCCLS